MKAWKTKALSLFISLIVVAKGINLIYRVAYYGDSHIRAALTIWAMGNFKTDLLMQIAFIVLIPYFLYQLRKKEQTIFFFLILVLFVLDIYEFSFQTLARFEVIWSYSLLRSLVLFDGIICCLGGLGTAMVTIMTKNQKEIPASKHRLLYIIFAIASFIITALIGILYYH
jgi:hypothetical protein